MAIILEFRRPEDAVSRDGPPVDGTLGEIIIFPGVRIERRMTPTDAPRRSGSTNRRRTPRARKKSQA
jgi:hypothetical protein